LNRFVGILLGLAAWAPFPALQAQSTGGEPLKLVQTIPLPKLHDGDFDHFAVDLPGQRLFLAAEENSAVEVFDLRTDTLIHTIPDVKAPHSILYRADLGKLFVVDGDSGQIKIYGGKSLEQIGAIQLKLECDSIAFDPASNVLYVVNGGRETHEPYSFVSLVNLASGEKLADIKIDSGFVDAIALDKSTGRLFANMAAENAVAVIDIEKRAVVATWSVAQQAHLNLAMSFDSARHRLFVVARKPARLIVLDTDSGQVVASLPCVDMSDEVTYDAASKRIYIAGTEFVDVFQQRDPDHYDLIGHIANTFRAKTAILVPQLSRYFVAAPHHLGKAAEVRVYQVMP
jgi:DNA-binding beta-propeller fold protein YncE